MTQANWMGSDSDRRQRFERAMNVSNSGAQLLQTFINRTVQMLTVREFGLQAVLPRRTGTGDAEYINRRTAGTNGGEWVIDTDSVTEESGTYEQKSFPYKTLVTRGKITRKLQATGRSYADLLALEMAGKAEDFAAALEAGLLSAQALAVAAKEPTGFLTMIQYPFGTTTLNTSQVISNTGTTYNAALTLSKLDEAIDAVKGSSQRGDLVIVGSFTGIRRVNAALQGVQRFNNVTEIAAGFRVRTYDGIPLIVSTAMPNNLFFAANGTITGSGSGADNGTCLMILNKRYNYTSELTPTTVMPLSKSDSQFDQFDMFTDVAPVFANTKGGALLCNILSS